MAVSGTHDAAAASAPRVGLRGGTPPWVVVAFTVALLFVFIGERIVPTIRWVHWPLTALGVLGVLALTALRWIAVGATGGERRSIERVLAILSSCGAAAVLIYLTTADPFEGQIGVGSMSSDARHRYEVVATVLWIALVIGSVVPMWFAERALYPMRRAARVEWRRVRDATTAGLVLALAAVYGTLFTAAAGEVDVKADFSYFHTAEASESTRKMAASAKVPIRVVAFFPDVNDVRPEVDAYLAGLASGQPMVRVEMHDRLLVPELARDLKVNEDGVLVVEYGPERESLSIGTELSAARPKLKTLDADFQKALMKVMRERRTAYFTVGHGELNDTQPSIQNEGRTGQGVRRFVEQQNYVVRDLGATSGLGVDVPDDGSLLVVLGPMQAFLPEEVAALARYADKGGRFFVCLDPDAKVDLAPLASVFGLTITSAVLANDKTHLRRHMNDSDNIILVTNRYSSHASVSTLSRLSSRPVAFLGAGALDKKPGADAALKVDFTVRALPDTFDDLNGNFRFDPPAEKRQAYPLAAAVSRSVSAAAKKTDEMRAFVVSDADAASDAALSNEPNLILMGDGVRWLGGEESFAGAMQTSEDVRIEHTKQKDLLWFYGTIFAAPAIVLGAGLAYTQRLRRAAKKKPKGETRRASGEKEAA